MFLLGNIFVSEVSFFKFYLGSIIMLEASYVKDQDGVLFMHNFYSMETVLVIAMRSTYMQLSVRSWCQLSFSYYFAYRAIFLKLF